MARTRPHSSAGNGSGSNARRVTALETMVEALQRESAIHLKRIAQLQADIDAIRLAWLQVKAPRPRRSQRAARM
jgi:hypothetical protein